MLGFFHPEPIATRRNQHAGSQAKGKAAAEAAAIPVMEESKMETTILYHRKMKPPRMTRGGPDHCCKHEHDTALRLQIRGHYTPGNERTALSARLSRKHTPKSLTTQERRMSSIIGSLLPLSTKKPPGRLIPRRLANPDATAVAASRYLQNVGSACSKPQNTRCRHKKRCPYYTRLRRVLSTPCGPLFLAVLRDHSHARAVLDLWDACNAGQHRHDCRKRCGRRGKRPINAAKRGARSDYGNCGLRCRLERPHARASCPLQYFFFQCCSPLCLDDADSVDWMHVARERVRASAGVL